MNRFRFGAVVWGTAFADAFSNVCLPSLLSPGNLVYFAQHTDSMFRIYTTTKDAEIIQKSIAYKHLSLIMPVEMVAISGMSYVGKYKAMTQCHAHFIRSNRGDDCAFVFVSPDIVMADGGFARLLQISNSGKRIVAMGAVRLLKETFIPAYLRLYSKDGKIQPITPRELVKLALDHLHPITVSQFWDPEKDSSMTPVDLLWPVDQEGFLLRQFHPCPLMIWPVDKDAVPTVSVDADYGYKACPNHADAYVVQDSDEMCLMEFSSLSSLNDLKKNGGRQSVESVVQWVKTNTNVLHREFAKHKIRFHHADCSAKWRDFEERSDVVVESILSLIEDSDNATASSPLSGKRYLSPYFLAGKLRQQGVIRFLKQVFLFTVCSVMRRLRGPSIRIRMLTSC